MTVEIIRCSHEELEETIAEIPWRQHQSLLVTPSDIGSDGKVVQYLVILTREA